MFHKHDQVENFVAVVEIKFNPEALAEKLFFNNDTFLLFTMRYQPFAKPS